MGTTRRRSISMLALTAMVAASLSSVVEDIAHSGRAAAATAECDALVWAGDGPDTRDLWTADASGSNRRNITDLTTETERAADFAPQWSPDGTQIAWGSHDGTTRQIFTADTDGTNRRTISDTDPGTDPTDNASPQWSPDGTQITWSGHDGTTRQIFIADTDGTNRRTISDTDPGTDPTDNASPQWSPDGTQITWSGHDGTTRQIFIADTDGTNRRTISDTDPGTDPTDNASPQWSPDGTQITWSGHDGTTRQIFIADTDGTNRRTISDTDPGTDPTDNASPQWSPDGTQITWSGHDGTTRQIFIADTDGTNRRTISDTDPGTDPTDNASPQWSPDGTQVIWSGHDGTTHRIFTANTDGTNRRVRTGRVIDEIYDELYDALRPEWSPDGSEVVFRGRRHAQGYSIMTTVLKRFNFEVVSVAETGADPTNNYGPAWSPDGTRVAWAGRGDSGRTRVWVADADGSSRTWVGGGSEPQWSPDGTRLAYSASSPFADDSIVVRDLAADGRVISRGFGDSGPQWSPDGSEIAWWGGYQLYRIYVAGADGSNLRIISGDNPADNFGPQWSPDGTRIAWSGNDGTTQQIVIADTDGTNRRTISDTDPGTDPTDNASPQWSPDGTQITWSGHDGTTPQIFIADTDGTNRRTISDTDPGTDPTDNAWPQWSPDGTQITWSGHDGTTRQIFIADTDGTNRRTISDTDPGTDPTDNSSQQWWPRPGDVRLTTSATTMSIGASATITISVDAGCPHSSVAVAGVTPPPCLVDASVTVSTGTLAAGTWTIDHLDGTETATITGTVTATASCAGIALVARSYPTEPTPSATLFGEQTCPSTPHEFDDVPPSSFASTDIACIKALGITTGTGPTTYNPDGNVTREQIASFIARLWRALGETCPSSPHEFTDVPPSSFANTDIACIKALGITTGTGPTTYNPDGNVTREQIASFIARLWRALGETCPSSPHEFTDVSPSSFANTDIACIKALGITTGTGPTTYNPDGNVTREQIASFIARLWRAASLAA